MGRGLCSAEKKVQNKNGNIVTEYPECKEKNFIFWNFFEYYNKKKPNFQQFFLKKGMTKKSFSFQFAFCTLFFF
jgi:hypothetical protein